MDNYITKRMSGHFSHSSKVGTNEYSWFTDFYFTQWYDAKLNKSLFVIDRIMVNDIYVYEASADWMPDYSKNVLFDGKIKINGQVVYTASKSAKNTYVVGTDSDRVKYGKYSYDLPMRTTTQKNQDGSDAILSLSVIVDHNEDRSGTVRIELIGNSSSSFYVSTVYGNTGSKTYTYPAKEFIDGANIKEDGGDSYFTSNTGGYLKLYGATIQTILSVTDTVAGQYCNVRIDPNPDYYYKLDLSCGDWHELRDFNGQDVELNANGVQIAYHGLIPLHVLYAMPDVPRRKMRAALWTYLDDECTNPVGDSDPAYFYVSVPANVIPIIKSSSANVKFVDPDYNIGEALSQFSYVNLSMEAEGVYGSFIEKYIITGVYNEEIESELLDYNGAIISTNGLKEFGITAVDSRGMRSEVKQFFINFYDYEKPVIKLFDVYRNEENKSEIRFKAFWEISPVNSKNTATAIIKYKKKVDSAWKLLCDVESQQIDPDQSFSVSNPDDSENGIWDEYTSYDFMLVVTDLTKHFAEQYKTVSTIKVILDFKEPKDKASMGGVGIGKACELDDHVEIGLDTKFYNKVYIGDDILHDYIVKTMRIQSENVPIVAGDFKEYYPILSEDYPYRVQIPIAGVDSTMTVEVFFSFEDVMDANFSGVANTYDGGVYLYANSIPNSSKTIPLIICRR